jgi:hypothetical protein
MFFFLAVLRDFCEKPFEANTACMGWQCVLRRGQTTLPGFDAFIFALEAVRETTGF